MSSIYEYIIHKTDIVIYPSFVENLQPELIVVECAWL